MAGTMKVHLGIIVALLALVLASCFDDQKRQVAACELEAMKVYPGKHLMDSPTKWANTSRRAWLPKAMTLTSPLTIGVPG